MGLGLRAIVFGFMLLFFIFPSFMAKTTGHYYLGFKDWTDILAVSSWQGVVMWSVIGIWMIYPVVIRTHHEIFVRKPLLEMADKSIDQE